MKLNRLLLAVILMLSLFSFSEQFIGNYSTNSPLRRLIYDDQFIWNNLDGRLHYLKRVNENNETIGYIGLRDYFNLSKVYWPDEEYLAEKNIEQYLYEELKASDIVSGLLFTDDIWQYSNEKDLIESGGLEADEKQCLEDLQYLHGEIEKANNDSDYLYSPGRRQMELLRWIDTWGRPPSEALWGNTFWVGSYRGCKLVSVPRDDNLGQNNEIRFNFCWAKLLAKDWNQEDIMIPKVTMRSGICLPRSCDTIMARKYKNSLKNIMKYNFSPIQRERFLNRSIDDIYCLPLKRPNVPLGSRFTPEVKWFIWITGIWSTLIVASTIWFSFVVSSNNKQNASTFSRCFECLSVQRNWTDLMEDNIPKESLRIDLRAFGLLKLFSCILVTFSHCFEFIYWFYRSSTIHVIYSRTIFYLMSSWCLKTVDMFFVITGTLTSYTLLARLGKDRLQIITQSKYYFLINLVRFLRFSPLLIFGLSFTKAVFIHLSEGPFWDYATYNQSYQGLCQKLSWSRLLIWPIVFDFGSKGGDSYQNECLPVSWYMVADIKMFSIIPFYFYILYKQKKWRLHLLGATAIISMLWNYAQMSLQNLVYFRQTFQYGMGHAGSILICYLDSSYFSPINRFYGIAFGLFAGIKLYDYKRGKIADWPIYMRRMTILAIILWQLYDMIFRTTLPELHYRATGEMPSEESLKWMPLLRQRFDVIMMCILILRVASDWSGPLMRNASNLYKLSKLSYCVYIIHTPLMHYMITAGEFSRPDSELLQFALFSVFIITMSLIIALPVYLFIESPLSLLLNQALDKSKILGYKASSLKKNTTTVSSESKHSNRNAKVAMSIAVNDYNKNK